ncbi:hypothetical protein J3B02_002317 [Coemansia erecta]|nr:hypothetical protein J3B02_002317 [Coemansia erecta]KAJ2881851.1 hypothetical protein FB639_002524 [Coemansia asiatica]
MGTAVVLSGYVYDKEVQASSVWRTLRTFIDVGIICLDYKINFRSEKDIDTLDKIHRRAARRLLRCCQENGGLFIKFGQSIAVQSSLLPPPFRKELSVLYDNAPSVSVDKIAPAIESSFGGKRIGELFEEFSEEAVASASVAQVHVARLKKDPSRKVAVKVQKPEIRLQIDWDLFTFRTCARIIQYAFGIPIMWSVKEVELRLREELDFEREANNSELAQKDLDTLADGWLKRGVYIPRVFWEATSKQVLTTEWIDGTSLVDPKQLLDEKWSGREIMQRMVSLFAFQIFVSGNVHGDPHPGNILVRQHPQSKFGREPQLVLLDHGLYVRETPAFRKQYAEFWRAAVIGDKKQMKSIAQSWGMPDAGMFSTMVSLKPPQLGLRKKDEGNSEADQTDVSNGSRSLGSYDRQMEIKKRAITALRDSSNLPPELVFVVRNTNIVRANNQSLGIPVNRIKILGQYAALGLRRILIEEAWSSGRRYSAEKGVVVGRVSLVNRVLGVVAGEWSYVTFRLALWAAGVGMALYGLWGRVLSAVTGKPYSSDLDSVMDDAMRQALEKRLGYRIDMSLFNA